MSIGHGSSPDFEYREGGNQYKVLIFPLSGYRRNYMKSSFCIKRRGFGNSGLRGIYFVREACGGRYCMFLPYFCY